MDLYQEYCTANKFALDDNIKKAFMKAGISGELILSGVSLNSASSAAIGTIISKSKTITKLDISDCLLSVTCLNKLLQHLINSQLIGLNLKGNNIFGEGVDALSRFLLKNKTIKMLKLEWNNLGSSVDGFSQLCHALSSNHTLEILDLRNNELSAECAFELFDAIARNNSLKELDLRWNNLGLEGGQSLLSALRSNKSLTDVKVQGNSIPGEITSAIEASVDHNKVSRRIQHEYSQRSQLLSEQIQHIEQQRTNDMKMMAEQNNLQIQSALEQVKERNRRVCELETELQESQTIISHLETQLNSLSSELFVSREKADSQNEVIKKQDQQIKSLTVKSENDLENFKKKLHDRERVLGDKIEELQAEINTERKTKERIDIQLKDSLNYIDTLTSEITALKDKLLSNATAHTKALDEERKLYEETVEKLQQEILSLQAKNLEIVEKTQQTANSRILLLESKLESSENAKAELNAQFLLEKSKWTEEKSSIWAEATEKQMCKILILTEKMEHANQDKQRLEQELALIQMTVNNLQRENSTLRSDLAEPPRKIAQLQEELSNERLLTQRLRSEKAEEMRTVDQLRIEINGYKGEISNAHRQVADLQAKLEMLSVQHQRDLEAVNWKLQEKAKEIVSIRAEEKERAGVLYIALNKYLSGLQSDT